MVAEWWGRRGRRVGVEPLAVRGEGRKSGRCCRPGRSRAVVEPWVGPGRGAVAVVVATDEGRRIGTREDWSRWGSPLRSLYCVPRSRCGLTRTVVEVPHGLCSSRQVYPNRSVRSRNDMGSM